MAEDTEELLNKELLKEIIDVISFLYSIKIYVRI